jgi:hypothetical protein
MKLLISLFLIFPLISFGQGKYALIDKNYKLPILFSDSISVEQVSKGFFPVEVKHIDTLIANIKYLQEMLTHLQRAKMESFELRASNAIFKTKRVPYAYGDRYETIIESTSGEVVAQLKLVNSNLKNKKNAENLGKVLDYLRNNKSFFRESNEITPKLYNVIVITDK